MSDVNPRGIKRPKDGRGGGVGNGGQRAGRNRKPVKSTATGNGKYRKG